MSATKASWGKMDNIKERFRAVIAALSNDCHVSSNQRKAKLIQAWEFLQAICAVVCQKMMCCWPAIFPCLQRRGSWRHAGRINLVYNFPLHFPFCLQFKSSILKYTVGMKTEKERFIMYITRLDNMLSSWPGCVTQSQPNWRRSQDPGIPQPFTAGFCWKESWELELTYTCSSHCPFWM